MVDGLLEHGVEEAVDTETNVATAWVSAGGVSVGRGRLTIGHIQLIWVPFSESENLVVILHLLGNDSSESTLLMLKRYSHLTDVLSDLRVVHRRGNKVVTSNLELRESSALHKLRSSVNLVLLWLELGASSLSKSPDLRGIQFVFSNGDVLGFDGVGLDWPAGWVLVSDLFVEF